MYSSEPYHMDEHKQDGQLELTYSNSADTGCSPEDLPEAMDDREGWQERVARHDDDDDDDVCT